MSVNTCRRNAAWPAGVDRSGGLGVTVGLGTDGSWSISVPTTGLLEAVGAGAAGAGAAVGVMHLHELSLSGPSPGAWCRGATRAPLDGTDGSARGIRRRGASAGWRTMTRLAGKSALITGGSRGIGAAVARRLSAEGASVAINYLSRRADAEALAQELAGSGNG